jgi:hypothetical protein
MAGLSHYCERDHQRTGTGDDCRQEYWKRRHKLNWTGRSNKLISEDWAKLMRNLSFENVLPLIISLGESDSEFDAGNDDSEFSNEIMEVE